MKPNEKDGPVRILKIYKDILINAQAGSTNQIYCVFGLLPTSLHLFQSSHLDDLLDSDEPCCQWEAVAKRQEKKIKRLESDLAMMQETMKKQLSMDHFVP